jgi:hypothetical protein
VAVAVGGGIAWLARSPASAPAAGSGSSVTSAPGPSSTPSSGSSPTPLAVPSSTPLAPAPSIAPSASQPSPHVALQECPSRAQVIDAAMARNAGREEMVVTVGPRCAHGWAAAIVGAPSAGTQRIVFKRESAGFVVVSYQPTMEPCPALLATMPAELRSMVAC